MSKRSRQRAQKSKLGGGGGGGGGGDGSSGASGGDPAHDVATAPAVAAPIISKAQKRNAQKRRAAQKRRDERQDDAATSKKQPKKQPKQPKQQQAGPSALPVVHEDEHVVAINKPAGLLCHPSPGYWEHGTVVHELAARQRLPGFSPIPPEMLGERQSHTGEADSVIPRAIVHRLDRGTTGLMLIAKTTLAEAHLTQQFKGRTTRKKYVALLHGRLRDTGAGRSMPRQPGEIFVDAPIGRDPARPGKMRVDGDGSKAAQSVVHVHAYCASSRVALVSVDLLTGRQHQIRVHCAHLGAAVANDEAYGTDVASFRQLAAPLGPLPRARPLLHAWSMAVPHPVSALGTLEVHAPLPADMQRIVAQLWPQLSTDPSAWPRMPLARMDEADRSSQ